MTLESSTINEFNDVNSSQTNVNQKGTIILRDSTINGYLSNSGNIKLYDSEMIISKQIHYTDHSWAGNTYGVVKNSGTIEFYNSSYKITNPNNSGGTLEALTGNIICDTCDIDIYNGGESRIFYKSSTSYSWNINNLTLHARGAGGNSISAFYSTASSNDIISGNITIENVKTGYGIYSKTTSAGNLSYTGNLNVNGTNAYGVYVDSGNLNISYTNGIINATGTTAYGIYINNGSVTMGVAEDSSSPNYGTANADVSTTNPSVKAVGTTTGIGVKKINGIFDFYDGIIIGSTAAKPEVATHIEYGFEAYQPEAEPTNGDGYKTNYLYFLTD